MRFLRGLCCRCPTATLSEKTLIAAGQAERSVTTTCAYCSVDCSFVAEVKGQQVVRMVPDKTGGANDLRAALGLALGGIPAVLPAALVVKSLPIVWLRWLVVVVVLYTATVMLSADLRGAPAVPVRIAQSGDA